MSKKLFIAALAIVLSAGCSMATNITGITGQNGVYNINPEHFSGNAGYRKYDNFNLSQGDIANLNFVRSNGEDPSVFINLVGSNGIQIDGIVNTVRNGDFYNGHAVFITPGAFAIGSSGVLNVGNLSVGTPTQSTYNSMVNGYGTPNFDYAENIGHKVSKLAQNSDGTAGAADITIAGKVFSQKGIEMAGKNVNLPGNLVNGLLNSSVISSNSQADALFNALVNTNGTISNSAQFTPVARIERILVKSENGLSQSGTVTNVGNVYLTNRGTNGMTVTGGVASNDLVRLYNTKGNLQVKNNAQLNGDSVIMQNKGANLTVDNSVTNAKEINVRNNGTGLLLVKGNLNADGELSVKNETGSGMTIDNSALLKNAHGDTAIRNKSGLMQIKGEINTNNGNTAIINEGSRLEVAPNSNITHSGSGQLYMRNAGENGFAIAGKINNNGNLHIINDKGILSMGADNLNNPTTAAKITNTNGNINILSRKSSRGLVVGDDPYVVTEIKNTNGNISIRHKGTGNPQMDTSMSLGANIKTINNGTIAINNHKGNMSVGGNIESAGNIGIVNRAGGGTMNVGTTSPVTSSITGKNINIKNNGSGDMSVYGTINNSGRVNVLANKGKLNLGATVHNNSGALGSNGGFYVLANNNGTGINVTQSFNADGNGEVLIRNASGANGLNYAGTINTTGHQAALVNKRGDMVISGTVQTSGAPVVISSKGNKMTINSSAVIKSGTLGNLYDDAALDPVISPNATIRNMEGHGKLLGQNWN